jgi:integrase
MLTDVSIKTAKLKKAPYKIFDGGGLHVLVNPGGSKLWRLKYRFQGKERLASFGSYPIVSLKLAREKRDAFRRHLASGEDPMAVKTGVSFEAVAREFVEKQAKRRRPRYLNDTLRRLELNVFPDLGQRPIASIEAPDLLSTLRKIEKRGAHSMAGRIRSLCGQVFRYGIASGYCKRDISADLQGALTPHKVKHQPAIKPDELPELLHKIEGYDGDEVTRLGLQFLALTFVRTIELIPAEWTEFDLKDALWTVPGSRMKMRNDHYVPLTRQTLDLLKELQELNGESRYVFAAPGNPDKHISNNTLLYALYRLGYRSRMTGHGFRSVASTILNEERERGSHNFGADVIERQLDHCERDEVRGAYNRAEYLQSRRAMMQWYADHLQEKIP